MSSFVAILGFILVVSGTIILSMSSAASDTTGCENEASSQKRLANRSKALGLLLLLIGFVFVKLGLGL